MIKPRSDLAQVPGYTPGRSSRLVQDATGLNIVVKLASNESLWGPSPDALRVSQEATRDILRYPEAIPTSLIETLARIHHLPEDNLIVGNGADEILRLLAYGFLSPGDDVISPAPSFSAYRFDTLLVGANPIEVPLTSDGRMDLPQILQAITPKTRMIYLCSPNNPTGGIILQKEWDQFIAQVPDNILVVVDQAYYEFVDHPEYAQVAPDVLAGRPVAMVRTFSKIYGLAGLRVGWALVPSIVVDTVQRIREPFSVNLIAEEAAEAAAQDTHHVQNVMKESVKARQFLIQELTHRGMTPFPTQANFVTFEPPVAADPLLSRLESLGFIVRSTTSFGLKNHIRVTIAPIPILENFLTAFDQAVSEMSAVPSS